MRHVVYSAWVGSFAVLSLGLALPAHGQFRVQKSAFANSGMNGFSQQRPFFQGPAGMQKACGNGQGTTTFNQSGGVITPFSQGGLQNPFTQGGIQKPQMQGAGMQNPFRQRGGLPNPLMQGIEGSGPNDPAQLQMLIQMLQYRGAAMQMQAMSGQQ
jgi:hypothetical protein